MTSRTDWKALAEAVRAVARPGGAEWLDRAVLDIVIEPERVRTAFPAVTREVGSAGLGGAWSDWTADDGGRAMLLHAVGDAFDGEIGDLYRFGDTAERRGVLRSLDVLGPSASGGALVRDALRTNDPQLVVAALGHFGVSCLTHAERDHGVMKCVFMEVPLVLVPAATAAPRPELSRMLAGFVVERVTAGRAVHPDVWPLIDANPPTGELDAVLAMTSSDVPERAAAARAALALRSRATSNAGSEGIAGRGVADLAPDDVAG